MIVLTLNPSIKRGSLKRAPKVKRYVAPSGLHHA
jgi:hypothetical protein